MTPGEPDPVWALHGSLGTPDDWPPGVRGIALYERLAPYWDFARRLNAEARDAPLLVGYSLGGRLALHALIAAAPGTWRGAVVVSAHPGLTAGRRARREADARWARKIRGMEPAAFQEEWDSQPVFAGAAPPTRRHEGAREPVARGFELWSLGRQEDLRPRLADIACPLLWVTGEHDTKFRALAEGLPVRHLTVAGAGHRVPWEQPDAFWEAVWRFDSSCRKL